MTKQLLRVMFVALLGFSPVLAGEKTEGLFVAVTSEDPQTQMMAMVLSTQAMKKGAAIEMLLCGPGGDLALQAHEQTLFKTPMGERSPQMMLKNLIKNGATVEVCAIYLPTKGITADALIEGVGSAKPPKVADTLLKPDWKIFSF
jgi:predicted peroxiredoxin